MLTLVSHSMFDEPCRNHNPFYTLCPFYVAIWIKNGLNIFFLHSYYSVAKIFLELALDTTLLVRNIFDVIFNCINKQECTTEFSYSKLTSTKHHSKGRQKKFPLD